MAKPDHRANTRSGPPLNPWGWLGSRPTGLIWWALVMLVIGACTETDTSPSTSTTATDPEPIGAGRLVILDGIGNVAVVDPDGSNLTTLTDDAGETAIYTQPLWSPDGSGLAWGRITESDFAVALHEVATGETTSVVTPNLPFFISWSPDGNQLGVLHNGTTAIDLNLIDVSEATITRVDNGAPYYFSWSPDGGEMVTHVGEDRVETIDSTGERTPAQPTGPGYLAPQWTGAGVFHVVDDSIVVEGDDGIREPVVAVSGPTLFVASPDGARVALQTSGQGGTIDVVAGDAPAVPAGRVVVVDLSDGTFDTVTETQSIGFFWSPDGASLLTLMPGDEGVEPLVWTGGETTTFDSYRPAPSMLQDTFPFFPQYAQSVRFWSPDSKAFAYAGDIDGETGIWIQELAADTPVKVADGRWVAWSGG